LYPASRTSLIIVRLFIKTVNKLLPRGLTTTYFRSTFCIILPYVFIRFLINQLNFLGPYKKQNNLFSHYCQRQNYYEILLFSSLHHHCKKILLKMEKPKLTCIFLTILNLNNWYTHTSGTVADFHEGGGSRGTGPSPEPLI